MMRIIAFMLFAACGAAPDKPMLANAPHPSTSAVAGGAAAAAAALTLASPDTMGAKPETNQESEAKTPVKVKENVPSGVLDRLDKNPAEAKPAAAKQPPAAPSAKQAQPAGAQKPDKRPKDALDFSQ